MNLYIKQRVFSLGDNYDVYDENQNIVYLVKGLITSIGAIVSIFDYTGKQLYYIKQRMTFLLAHYELYKDNYLVADVRCEFALFKPRLSAPSGYGNFSIVGDIFSMDFEILKDNVPVGRTSKKWLTWGDTYELDIY